MMRRNTHPRRESESHVAAGVRRRSTRAESRAHAGIGKSSHRGTEAATYPNATSQDAHWLVPPGHVPQPPFSRLVLSPLCANIAPDDARRGRIGERGL